VGSPLVAQHGSIDYDAEAQVGQSATNDQSSQPMETTQESKREHVAAKPKGPVMSIKRSQSSDSIRTTSSVTGESRLRTKGGLAVDTAVNSDSIWSDDDSLGTGPDARAPRFSRRRSVDSLLDDPHASKATNLLRNLPTDQSRQRGTPVVPPPTTPSSLAAQQWIQRRAQRQSAVQPSALPLQLPSVAMKSPRARSVEPTPVVLSWLARLTQAAKEGEVVLVDGIGSELPSQLRGLVAGPHIRREDKAYAYVQFRAVISVHTEN